MQRQSLKKSNNSSIFKSIKTLLEKKNGTNSTISVTKSRKNVDLTWKRPFARRFHRLHEHEPRPRLLRQCQWHGDPTEAREHR